MYANKISEVQCFSQSSIAGTASDLIRYNTSFIVVEPCGVQVLKNPNPLKDVEPSALFDVVVLV